MVVDFEDTKAMAEALVDLLSDPARLRAFGLAGRKKVLSTHVVDNTAPKLLACLLRAVAAAPA